jgi:hypothetical protein
MHHPVQLVNMFTIYIPYTNSSFIKFVPDKILKDNVKNRILLLSEWLLFNANSAIFQLYHGEIYSTIKKKLLYIYTRQRSYCDVKCLSSLLSVCRHNGFHAIEVNKENDIFLCIRIGAKGPQIPKFHIIWKFILNFYIATNIDAFVFFYFELIVLRPYVSVSIYLLYLLWFRR